MPPTPSRHDVPGRLPGPAGTDRSRARIRRLAGIVLLAALPMAGCGTPPELQRPAPTRTPAPLGTPSATPTPTPATSLPSPGLSGPSGDPGLVAVPCPDGPSGARVIDLVRSRNGVLPGNVRVRVDTGPLCAGDWHYTVLEVTGHEALQVITEGRPGALRLITAGTDVCTAEVRVAGPPGIRTRVCEAGPLGVPGA